MSSKLMVPGVPIVGEKGNGTPRQAAGSSGEGVVGGADDLDHYGGDGVAGQAHKAVLERPAQPDWRAQMARSEKTMQVVLGMASHEAGSPVGGHWLRR
ncbi:MAG: hypothetical protein U0974_11775 [Gemmatimonadales bacterium]|nr:hypothetical protein [Gemmatimonadales bacterium]MDZ4390394.1 hypothetical protein [Gemmatimonadales bacterium]